MNQSLQGGETRQHIVVDYHAEALPTPPYHSLLHHISSLLAVPHIDTKQTNLNQKLFLIVNTLFFIEQKLKTHRLVQATVQKFFRLLHITVFCTMYLLSLLYHT